MEIQSIRPFLSYWERVRGRTARLVPLIPEEKLEWTYRAGKYTLGDLVATSRVSSATCTRERPGPPEPLSRPRPGARRRSRGRARLLQKATRGVGRDLRRADAEELERKCITPGGAEIATWKWLRAMVSTRSTTADRSTCTSRCWESPPSRSTA